MSFFSRLKNKTIAMLATRIPSLQKRLLEGYQSQQSDGASPWIAPATPLKQARLALVTTSGIHHPAQEPFNMSDPNGDPTYRVIDGATIFKDFKITHDYYDHSDARKDPNIVLPIDRVQELVDEGSIGSISQNHYALMGHIDGEHIETLKTKTAPEIVRDLKKDKVDIVLLVPA